MNAAEKLEREIKKMSGERSEEIINAVRDLAEIDVMIKEAMDEIERFDADLVRRHNELADMINGMVERVVTETDIDDQADSQDSFCENEPDLQIRVELRVIKTAL